MVISHTHFDDNSRYMKWGVLVIGMGQVGYRNGASWTISLGSYHSIVERSSQSGGNGFHGGNGVLSGEP